MPAPEPEKLTDKLWLTAHDSVGHKPCISERALGLSLASGLLGELIYDGNAELRDGKLFRIGGSLSHDPALDPLLRKMAEEERRWMSPAPPRPRPPVDQYASWARADLPRSGVDWPTQVVETNAWQPPPFAGQERLGVGEDAGRHAQPRAEPTVNHQRGHDLGEWMAYLARGRAEARVTERLARAGLARRQERRRLLGASTVRYVPHDSAIAGSPASIIRQVVHDGQELNRPQLLLAGLFLATGLHHHALATLSPYDRARLSEQLQYGLDPMSRELLRAADAAIGEAAML